MAAGKYNCPDCQDKGWITVWHPRAQAAALAYLANHLPEDKFRRNLYEAAAKCRCQAGQDRPGDVATYNPDCHVPITVAGHAERVKALLEDVQKMKPSNHISEFDDWNGW